MRSLSRSLDKPMVVDADALTALAGHLRLLRAAPSGALPHAASGGDGPDARCRRGATISAIDSRRRARSRPATEPTVVLTGRRAARSPSPDGRVFVNPTGNPGMASGGTGDDAHGHARRVPGARPGRRAARSRARTCTGAQRTSRPSVLGEESLIARDVIARRFRRSFRSSCAAPRDRDHRNARPEETGGRRRARLGAMPLAARMSSSLTGELGAGQDPASCRGSRASLGVTGARDEPDLRARQPVPRARARLITSDAYRH